MEATGSAALHGRYARRAAAVIVEEPPPRCTDCHEVIGAYEPVVVIADGEPARRTSRAAGPLPQRGVVLHEECFQRRREAQID